MQTGRFLVERVRADPGLVLVVGGPDTGKSTFVLELARMLFVAGLATAIVDTDTGQSDLGPPGTIAMARVRGPVARWSELSPDAAFFVGATSPPGVEATFLAGIWRMVEAARQSGAIAVVVNTTGLIHGPYGRYLKGAKLEGLRPRHLVALQRAGEVEHLLRAYPDTSTSRIWRLAVPPGVQRKDREYRRAAREEGYRRAMEGGSLRVLDLASVRCLRTRYRTGERLDDAACRALELRLGTGVVYAERAADGIYAVVPGSPPSRPVLMDRSRVYAVSQSAYDQLQVGLLDGRGELAGTGVLEGLDFAGGKARVYTPVEVAVTGLVFGTTRVTRDGRELGRLRPKEI
ncbi:MAG: Clp1/GlmU family protein [Bacillota bacterium]